MVDYNAELLKLDFVVDARTTLPRHPTKKWSQRTPQYIQGSVFHQSLENHGLAAGNAKYHVGPNHISDTGLPGLAYTGFIEKSGKLYLANSVEDVPWSQGTALIPGDENYLYISFCFGGNFSGPGYVGPQTPTKEQIDTAVRLWDALKSIFSFNNHQLFGHYDFGKPACPGYDLMKVIESINFLGSSSPVLVHNFNTITGRQEALKQLGYLPEYIVGEWDLPCKGALVKFQRYSNLVGDGVWGKNTEAAIIKALGKA